MASKILAESLSAIKNAETRNSTEVVRRPISKLFIKILEIFEKEGYIESFDVFEDTRGGEIKINLRGKINNVGVISPHYPVSASGIEKFEKRFLPAKNFGRLILTTPKGIMTHINAKKENTGGKLLAFVY